MWEFKFDLGVIIIRIFQQLNILAILILFNVILMHRQPSLLCSSRMDIEKSLSKSRTLHDRFIPNRVATANSFTSFCLNNQLHANEEYPKLMASRIMNQRVNGEANRIIKFKENQENNVEQTLQELLHIHSSAKTRPAFRSIDPVAHKILDAPELRDDYYLNLLDWSTSNGRVAIGLHDKVYLYTMPDKITELCNTSEDSYVCSVAFHSREPVLAIGNSEGYVELFDIVKEKLIRSMEAHTNRVSSIAFSNILYSGSKDTMIYGHDSKISNHIVASFQGHKGEVCGLKIDANGLASGSNDNQAIIWDINQNRQRLSLQGHKGAVKALAWCPWQRNVLATGGGTSDKTMRFWNTVTGRCSKKIDTQSQVSALIWNQNERQIVSAHGYSNNQLCIWSYPEFQKVAELRGHTSRILHLVKSPDGSMLCSGSADETLRFWKISQSGKRIGTDKKHTYDNLNSCSLR